MHIGIWLFSAEKLYFTDLVMIREGYTNYDIYMMLHSEYLGEKKEILSLKQYMLQIVCLQSHSAPFQHGTSITEVVSELPPTPIIAALGKLSFTSSLY